MSNRAKVIAKLKEYIKNLVVKELDEASTTASAGAANPMGTGIYYDTPYAFRSKRKKDKKKLKKITHAGGYKPVKEVTQQEVSALEKVHKSLQKIRKDYIKIYNIGDKTLKDRQYNDYYEYILTAEKDIGKLAHFFKTKQRLGEGRYHDWRNDESMTPKQKIGRSMREIRDALNELDKTVKMNLKLKTELNMNSQDYWKNTHKALTKISERLVKMANKVGNLK
jgi:membrane-associated HD superfamily phosphohydrolase